MHLDTVFWWKNIIRNLAPRWSELIWGGRYKLYVALLALVNNRITDWVHHSTSDY